MSAFPKTLRDRTMIALAIVPPIALVLFCVSAAATWQAGAAKIRPMLQQSFSPELIDSPTALAADYAARTSKEHTKSNRELATAIDALNDQYQLLFEVLDEQQDLFENLDAAHVLDEHLHDYLADAAPMLEWAKQLNPDQASIWQPTEIGNPNNYSSGLNSLRGLPETSKRIGRWKHLSCFSDSVSDRRNSSRTACFPWSPNRSPPESGVNPS